MVERKHVCPHCEFRTHRKYNLTMHIARIHKDLADGVPPVEVHQKRSDLPMNQELLEDSIHVLNIYNMLKKMKNKLF